MLVTFGKALTYSSINFISKARLEGVLREHIGIAKPDGGGENSYRVGKHSRILNAAIPPIDVDSNTYKVCANDELLTCKPATVLPMAHRVLPVLALQCHARRSRNEACHEPQRMP